MPLCHGGKLQIQDAAKVLSFAVDSVEWLPGQCACLRLSGNTWLSLWPQMAECVAAEADMKDTDIPVYAHYIQSVRNAACINSKNLVS